MTTLALAAALSRVEARRTIARFNDEIGEAWHLSAAGLGNMRNQ